jgi:hypothetical protein
LWRDDGTDQVIHDLPRCQAREKAGRAPGKDAAKKVPGRKPGLAVDALGPIIAEQVLASRPSSGWWSPAGG